MPGQCRDTDRQGRNAGARAVQGGLLRSCRRRLQSKTIRGRVAAVRSGCSSTWAIKRLKRFASAAARTLMKGADSLGRFDALAMNLVDLPRPDAIAEKKS